MQPVINFAKMHYEVEVGRLGIELFAAQVPEVCKRHESNQDTDPNSTISIRAHCNVLKRSCERKVACRNQSRIAHPLCPLPLYRL